MVADAVGVRCAGRAQQQPRRLDRVRGHRDRGRPLNPLATIAQIADAGRAAGLVDLDVADHAAVAHLDAVRERVGKVGDERAGLRADLAALQAEAAVDAVRTVAERAVDDRHRADPHLDPRLLGAAQGALGHPAQGMRRVRVAVRVAPRPVLAGDRQLLLEALVVRLEVAVGDRPVDADAVARIRLEVRGMEARRVAGVVDHRPADAVAAVVLAELDGVLSADHALLGPVEVVRSRLIGDPVAVGVPERPGLEDGDPPAAAGEALGEDTAAGARADHDEVDLVLVAEPAHRLRLRHGAAVDVEQERRVVLRRAHGALEKARPPRIGAHRSPPRSATSGTGSTSTSSSPSQLSRSPTPRRA